MFFRFCAVLVSRIIVNKFKNSHDRFHIGMVAGSDFFAARVYNFRITNDF